MVAIGFFSLLFIAACEAEDQPAGAFPQELVLKGERFEWAEVFMLSQAGDSAQVHLKEL